MSKNFYEAVDISDAACCLIDHIDQYFKDKTPQEACRLKLSVIKKLEWMIRNDIRENDKKDKFMQYELPL